jgi:serine/threonine protein phosphatase PrpC
MKISSTGVSDPGLIRSNNQDAYYIDPEKRFFIVADGMGGHAGGEEASRIATAIVRDYLIANWQSSLSNKGLLEQALSQANGAILQDQQKHPERADMGTTVVVLVFRGEEGPMCAHIGDSRLYLWRKSGLVQLTEDHTWIARAIKIGDISVSEARFHPFRHVLSRCLGREDLSEVDLQPLDLQVGDRLLLCSDGLTEELLDEKIADRLQAVISLDEAAVSLVEAAKEQGGHDNITVVLISLEADS